MTTIITSIISIIVSSIVTAVVITKFVAYPQLYRSMDSSYLMGLKHAKELFEEYPDNFELALSELIKRNEKNDT